MKSYRNLSGNSGVVGYEFGDDSIDVHFRNGTAYRYTYESAGESNVEHMKQLAAAGSGLSSFISRVVKDRYAFRLR